MTLSLTIILIVITAVTSFLAFSNKKLENNLIFYPPAITQRHQWYRFITCGFIHADIPHLAFNMFSFYIFSQSQGGIIGVEDTFVGLFGDKGKILFLLLYLTALVVCLLPTYFKHKNNSRYASLGASGAVSAVIFVAIFIAPLNKIGVFIIPPIIPGFIFAPIYLIGSSYMAKRGGDNINHSAHFWGAVYGVVFFIVACFALSNVNPITNFTEQVTMWFKSF